MAGQEADSIDSLIAAVVPCDVDVARMLSAHGRLRQCAAGVPLARQGEILTSLWLLLDGSIKLDAYSASGRSSRLGLHSPGDWIGNYARSASCHADIIPVGQTLLLSFATGSLPDLAEREPRIAMALALSFSRQLEHTLSRLDARSTLTAPGRICAELSARAGDGLTISPAPVVTELALAAQTTRETASRTLTNLERRGIIARTAEGLIIQSPRMLRDMAV